MILKRDVGAGEGAVWADEVVEEIPGCGGLVALSLRFLLLAQSYALFLFLLLPLCFFSLLGGGEEVAEGGVCALVGSGFLDRRCGNLRFWRWFELGLEGELEFEVVQDNEFEFLTDGGALAELKPLGCYAMETVVQGELEPCAFRCGDCQLYHYI